MMETNPPREDEKCFGAELTSEGLLHEDSVR